MPEMRFVLSSDNRELKFCARPQKLLQNLIVLLRTGTDCAFIFQGLALVDIGEAMRELGEVKDALDMEVKQNFIDPLQNLHEKDLKEIQVRVRNACQKKCKGPSVRSEIQVVFIFCCSIT